MKTTPMSCEYILLMGIFCFFFFFILIFSEEGRESKKKDFTILFVPRKTMLCERKLAVSNII